jgi:hypothetical protein
MINDLSTNAKLAWFIFGSGVFLGLLPGFCFAYFIIRRAEIRFTKLLQSKVLKAPNDLGEHMAKDQLGGFPNFI